ncbi:MAG: tRNA dimethylallyltransferase, partial [Pseudomonadota bacterium]
SELSAVDAKTAARLSPNDRQRIQRALEVYAITGTPLSALQTRDAAGSSMAGSVFPFISTIIALMPSARTVLHERIATRFGAMLDAGLIEEVRTLRESYLLNPEMPSMRCVGYRQVWQHLEGEIDTRTMREQGIAATRQLAKRQMTWLRSMSGVESFNCLDVNVDEKVAAHLGKHIIKLNGS